MKKADITRAVQKGLTDYPTKTVERLERGSLERFHKFVGALSVQRVNVIFLCMVSAISRAEKQGDYATALSRIEVFNELFPEGAYTKGCVKELKELLRQKQQSAEKG